MEINVATEKNYETVATIENTLSKKLFWRINATPMANDAHFVIPTDYYVNNKRGNMLYVKLVLLH